MFEVLQWPASELEWWAAFYSIDHCKDQPRLGRREQQASAEAFEQAFEREFG